MSLRCIGAAMVILLGLLGPAKCISPAYSEDEQADIKNAILRYQSAIEIEPGNPTTRLRLGRAYLMSGNLDGAIEQFKQAARLSPSDGEAYFGMARAMARKKDFDGAANALKDAVKCDPDN